jgi:hypothetical protein
VGVRERLLHDGCTHDLDDRFTVSCYEATPDTHGTVSLLTDDEIEALKVYLRTL